MLPARRRMLEIGSYEGRSSVWIMENMLDPDGELICVDTWEGSEEHSPEEMRDVEERFDHNVALASQKNGAVVKLKNTSLSALCSFQGDSFDFIYIDGSHVAKDVLTDACLAWPLLKSGGMMVFDDYMWGTPRDVLHRPKIAIDAFTNIFAEEAQIVHAGYQMVVRKAE